MSNSPHSREGWYLSSSIITTNATNPNVIHDTLLVLFPVHFREKFLDRGKGLLAEDPSLYTIEFLVQSSQKFKYLFFFYLFLVKDTVIGTLPFFLQTQVNFLPKSHHFHIKISELSSYLVCNNQVFNSKNMRRILPIGIGLLENLPHFSYSW